MSKMLKSLMLVILLNALNLTAQAQDVPRYRPQRPTISPYLNLLRNDSGALPNYYGLVRPQLNQQAFDNRVLAATRNQAESVRRLSDVTDAIAAGPTGSASTFGNLSHYQDVRSHYYPSKQKSSRRR